MSDIGMPARALLDGLEQMKAARKDIRAGDMVRCRLAVRGGCVWESARVIYAYPALDFDRRYDVTLRSGAVLRNVSEISLRRIGQAT